MSTQEKYVCKVFSKGETVGLDFKQKHDSPTAAFASCSRRIAKLLRYIVNQYGETYDYHWNPVVRRAERLPDPSKVKAPQTPFLEKMLRTSVWPTTRCVGEEQKRESIGECVPVDPVLLNGLHVDRPTDHPWKITVDRSVAMKLEAKFWMELNAIEDWLRAMLEHRNRYDTILPWEESSFIQWVEQAREGLAKWLEILFVDEWHDTVSVQTSEIDVDEDGWTQGPKRSRLSSVADSQRPSTKVTAATTYGPVGTTAPGASSDLVKDWIIVHGEL